MLWSILFWTLFVLGVIIWLIVSALNGIESFAVGGLVLIAILVNHYSTWYWALAAIAVPTVIGLLCWLGHEIRKKIAKTKTRRIWLAKLQSVKYDGCNLHIGQYLVPDGDIVCADSVRDRENNEVGVSLILKCGLNVILYHAFLHETAYDYLRGKMMHTQVFEEEGDFVKRSRSAHERFLALQQCREVVLCEAGGAIRRLLAMSNYRQSKSIDESSYRDIANIASLWLNDYLKLNFSYWSDSCYGKERSIAIARIVHKYYEEVLEIGLDNYYNELLEIGLDEVKCDALEKENSSLALELIKMRAFLLSRMNNGDPIGSYQLYTYFDENRSTENIKDRLVLMRGLGAERMSSERRVIVCTDNPRVEGTMEQHASGVFIASASDIHAYNLQDDVPANEKLEFLPVGHPVTNCTYIQHPTRKNCYIESSSYHLTILERKFVELQSVMRGVGAVSMIVEAGDTTESSSSYGKNRSNSLGGKYKGVGGSMRNSSSVEGSSFESVMYKLCMRGQWEPIAHRQLPDNLEFYEAEVQWKEIADAALKGQSPEVRVRLEIKRESEISRKTFKEAMVSVSCLITDFDASQSDEFEEKSRQMSSMCWDYHVVFGASTQQKLEDMSAANKASDGTQLSDGQRAEALILRMVRQFLTESGTITEENKKEIGGIASEFGVQKLRVLELIQCAKEQSSSPVQSIEMK